MKWIKENYQAIIIWIFFELVAVGLFIGTNKLFYLLNFSYIGTCISVGCYLYGHNAKYARNLVQFAVGLYVNIFGINFKGKYANRRILVLFVFGSI